MWTYTDITRDEFEKVKDHIEEIMAAHGAAVQDIDLPYSRQTAAVHKGSDAIAWESYRKVYKYFISIKICIIGSMKCVSMKSHIL